jgi:DNA-binding GntR family transcriptional regulator
MATPYAHLRQAILTGELPPGYALTETTLGEKYGVSRTPVREALRRLEQDGLAERGSRGMVVKGRSPEEILEIYEIRSILESAAASYAASRRTLLDIGRMEKAHQVMIDLDPLDPWKMVRLNRDFHEQIWAATHHSTLIDLLARLNDHVTLYSAAITLGHGDRWSIVLAEHEELLQAIRDGDAQRASEVAEAHMDHARAVRLEIYAGGAEQTLPALTDFTPVDIS